MTHNTDLLPPVAEQLAFYFRRNGYVRRPSPKRRADLRTKYKKGDEVRLVAASESELAVIVELLLAVGLTPGKMFRKSRQLCQPIYGRAQVERFLEMVGEPKTR